MPDTPQLLAFVMAGLLLNLTPGVDVFYVVSNALRQGVRAGIVAGLGIAAGCMVHTLAAALGISALIAASATAFTVLKWVGAAYLLWMGWGMLRSRGSLDAEAFAGGALAPAQALPLRVVFGRGFLTNVLNPKVALFFLAFLPQFIAPGTAHPAWVFLALGLLFNVNGLLVSAGWALAAAVIARRLRAGGPSTPPAAARGLLWVERAAGLLILVFGLKLALTEAPTGR
ncbi:LysE family translocator [Xenophilus arseniciresistens]|uniref:LysE family translocator n=1 Tax=Xenophilus arseniciresistens TaxID=1283306 RepID=A0AAE3T2U5_9BURK|nr:LysE family translocator [Xenophilus arseniciresistens]MDA7418792.1 LysE family translocator [Xenophilus arseniciresistens]